MNTKVTFLLAQTVFLRLRQNKKYYHIEASRGKNEMQLLCTLFMSISLLPKMERLFLLFKSELLFEFKFVTFQPCKAECYKATYHCKCFHP